MARGVTEFESHENHRMKTIHCGQGRFHFLAALFGSCVIAGAQWSVDATVPEWCQRGELHWALHYGKVTRSDVDLMIAARQNLDHGASYASPEIATAAAARGMHDLVYICSRTFVVKDYEKHPELQRAVLRAFDGSEVLAYGNPVRRYGCVNSPEWKAFVLGKVDEAQARRHPAGIFFDNEAWFNPCYCEVCRARFRDYSRARCGEAMELPETVDVGKPAGRAARLFLLDSQTAYHKALLEYCHTRKPRLLSVPNTCGMGPWPMHGIEEGVTDLPFYELTSHPPFGDNLYAYKVALAAGHGRNVGNLMYLPPAMAAARGKRTWNEGMHSFFHPSTPLAPEFALAIAEGAACDATYVANYNLFPSLPITDTKDPFFVNIHQTMNRYYEFLVQHRALYRNAAPGADVAILHSVPTDLWTGSARRWAQLAEKLNRAGVPYEVLVERDLKPQTLKYYRTLVVAGVRAIAESGAAALAAYVREGGRVLFMGECGVTDERGEPRVSEIIRQMRGSGSAQPDGAPFASAPLSGHGRVLSVTNDFSTMDGGMLRAALVRLMGPPGIHVCNPTGKLSVTVLAQPARKLREVHLVNYDFTYDRPPNQIADDDQTAESRSYLANTSWRIKKILRVPDLASFTSPALEIVGGVATAKQLIRLVVSLNGADVATLPADQLHGTLSIPLPKEKLVVGDNAVVLRVEGQPSAAREWYQVMIDEDARTGRSFFSKDAGRTWTRDDLSEDRLEQRGEFMIRLSDAEQRPTYAQWERMCHTHPAREVRVFVAGKRAPFAVALSPTAAPRKLAGARVEGGTEFTLDTELYTVMVLAEDEQRLSEWSGGTKR